jgi:hypothetical protein
MASAIFSIGYLLVILCRAGMRILQASMFTTEQEINLVKDVRDASDEREIRPYRGPCASYNVPGNKDIRDAYRRWQARDDSPTNAGGLGHEHD